MILTFSKDRFVNDILAGRKIHTIRRDESKRWRPGLKIHYWRGNPRNTHLAPYRFRVGICEGVQDILITRDESVDIGFSIIVNGKKMSRRDCLLICKNDGLTDREFRRWFLPPGVDDYVGRIIHFTKMRY